MKKKNEKNEKPLFHSKLNKRISMLSIRRKKKKESVCIKKRKRRKKEIEKR